MVFIDDQKKGDAYAGMAPVGTVCKSDNRGKWSINEYSTDHEWMGKVIAHEVGHILGMNHDTGSCIGKGAMAGGTKPVQFSPCSNQAFKKYYHGMIKRGCWCMDT